MYIGISKKISIDGNSLAVPVSGVINKFNFGKKKIFIISYGGTDLALWKVLRQYKYKNTNAFSPVKTMFIMECLDHIIEVACKAGVVLVKSDDGVVNCWVETQ